MRTYVVLFTALLLTACGGGESNSQSKPTESLPEAKHEAGAEHTHEHEASESLAEARDDSPEEHAKKHQDAKYVCPMHPEVVRDEPGSCPICGMNLVKQEETSEPGEEHSDTDQ